MKLVFLGSPEFAVPTLRALHAAGEQIALVVTRPDRPRGRSGRPVPTAVAEAARELGLDVFRPARASSPRSLAQLREVAPDLGVIVAYGELLSGALLSLPRQGFVNAHASLLPAYRGAAPINWAIIRGERVTGVSIIHVVPELDAGPVLAACQVAIAPGETAGELHDRLALVAAEAMVAVVRRLGQGDDMPGTPQPDEGGFFARKLTAEDGRLDWSLSAQELADRVRGLNPWPGAHSDVVCDGRTIRLTLLRAEPASAEGGHVAPGTVLVADSRRGLVVRAGEGVLKVTEIQRAGGRAMTAEEFLRGVGLQPGDRFE